MLKRTSNFNLGNKPSEFTYSFFTGEAPVNSEPGKLSSIHTALEKGIQEIQAVEGLDSAMECAAVTAQILEKLIERNGSTSIEVNTRDFILCLHENEGTLIISINSAERLSSNVTFEELTKTIIKNIISYPAYFSPPSIDYVLHYTFTRCTDEGLKNLAADYVAQKPAHFISHDSQPLLFFAANHVFLSHANYEEKTVRKLAILAVKSANHCQGLQLLEAAQLILRNHEKNYDPIIMTSASLVILFHHERCSDEALKVSTDYMTTKPDYYPRQFLIGTALAVIKTHWTFFRTPLKSREAQQDFVAFFKEKGAIETLTLYSSALSELLRFSDRKMNKQFTVEEMDSEQKQKVMKTLSIEGLWINGYFHRVLEANTDIAIFILQNMRHQAIKIWNSPTNKLAHSAQ